LGHTGVGLADGRVLVVGGKPDGSADGEVLIDSELYDPATATWADGGDMTFARAGHTATLLPDGRVLVVGGDGGGGATATAEIWASSSAFDPIESPVDQDVRTTTTGCAPSPGT
jgi:hypothetical protein